MVLIVILLTNQKKGFSKHPPSRGEDRKDRRNDYTRIDYLGEKNICCSPFLGGGGGVQGNRYIFMKNDTYKSG